MSRRRGDDLTGEDRRLWDRVTGTVTPRRLKRALRIEPEPPEAPRVVEGPARRPVTPAPPAASPPIAAPLSHHPRIAGELEPRRQRRLARERDPIDARIDLHGYGRFAAQDALTAFLTGARARGYGAVLVITGQGRRGGSGVIRASVHEWLQAPALRPIVSGFAPAHRRHGGDGAIYVTLRRG